MSTKTQGLRVNVTPDMDEALKRIAVADDVSVATVVRWALKSYIQFRHDDDPEAIAGIQTEPSS